MNLFAPAFNVSPWQKAKLNEIATVHDDYKPYGDGQTYVIVEFNEDDEDRVFDIFIEEDIQVEPHAH